MEEGKIQDLTRQVRGMQAVRGKWDHPHQGPATPWGWGPGLLRKVRCEKSRQPGSDEKCSHFIGDFPFSQSLKEPQGEMLLAELKMDQIPNIGKLVDQILYVCEAWKQEKMNFRAGVNSSY